MKNNENPKRDCAGRAASGQVPEAIMDRAGALQAVNEAYRLRGMAGASKFERFAGPGIEEGGTIYWKRRSGKVASFFRCLLR